MPDLTITVTTQQQDRAVAAFKRYWGMDTDPTPAQIKEWLVRQLRGLVMQQERAVAEAALSDTPFDPT